MSKALAKKGPVRALGAMSGTSLDGVDAAVVVTDGIDILGFGESDYLTYSADQRRVLHAALGCWPNDPGVVEASRVVMAAHEALLSRFRDVEIVGFHGQTLAHDPRGRGTHQVGDGDLLAADLGVPVVWDFRSADVGLGGEGAPLVPFFHHACARWIGAQGPLAFLNLGGVGNLTWVDPRVARAEDEGAVLAFDTGPANAPINDLIQDRRGLDYDEDGKLAMAGQVETGALELFLDDPYFSRMPPKSLDRNAFPEMMSLVRELGDEDAAATLTGMAAAAVLRGMEHCPEPPERLLVCGGGRRNPVLMEMLRVALDCPVDQVEEVGLDGDMLEAQAFGYLAVRVARGLATSGPSTTGVKMAVGGGQVSMP